MDKSILKAFYLCCQPELLNLTVLMDADSRASKTAAERE